MKKYDIHMGNSKSYLTDIPQEISEYGFCKVLMVRHEVIHIKHVMTELFTTKRLDLKPFLEAIGWNLWDYNEYITNRLRKIHHFPRKYIKPINEIVENDRKSFFPTINLYEGLNNVIVLDYDGVVTDKNFRRLYELCIERCKTVICSANPTIKEEWFIKHGLPLPHKIYSNKGRIAKMKMLIEIQKKHDNVFYVDDETKYLSFAWCFGIKTFHYVKGKIERYTMKKQ